MVRDLPRLGEIWWAEAEDGRRPVLVVTRTTAVPVLGAILVAPVTRTIRGIQTEIVLDQRHGVRVDCCASFDNLLRIRPAMLSERMGQLQIDDMHEICRALRALADC